VNTFSILRNIIMTNAEIEGFDLSTAGTIVELENTSSDTVYGFTVDATASADFVVEIRGGTVGYTTSPELTFQGTDAFSEAFRGPEVVDVRIRSTSTANGKVDVILGSGGR
jgi:hypothetical protein